MFLNFSQNFWSFDTPDTPGCVSAVIAENPIAVMGLQIRSGTADTDPGVSKDQKFYEKFKNTHCQVDHPAKIE